MEVAFYSCYHCGRTYERQYWLKYVKCQGCGGKKLFSTHLSPLRLWIWVLLHPSYLIKALKGN